MHENSTFARSSQMEIDIFASYAPLIGSVCRKYLNRRHDIEDAMQDTFMKMLSHGMDGSCPRLAGWLSAAAHTSCVDQLRRAGSEQRRRQGWSRIQLGAEEDGNERRELCERIEIALNRLDKASRQLLIERFYEDVPLRVIADRSGVSVSTVSRWGTAALRDLAVLLENDDSFEIPPGFSTSSPAVR